MTKAELIEILEAYPDDTEVLVYDSYWDENREANCNSETIDGKKHIIIWG